MRPPSSRARRGGARSAAAARGRRTTGRATHGDRRVVELRRSIRASLGGARRSGGVGGGSPPTVLPPQLGDTVAATGPSDANHSCASPRRQNAVRALVVRAPARSSSARNATSLRGDGAGRDSSRPSRRARRARVDHGVARAWRRPPDRPGCRGPRPARPRARRAGGQPLRKPEERHGAVGVVEGDEQLDPAATAASAPHGGRSAAWAVARSTARRSSAARRGAGCGRAGSCEPPPARSSSSCTSRCRGRSRARGTRRTASGWARRRGRARRRSRCRGPRPRRGCRASRARAQARGCA